MYPCTKFQSIWRISDFGTTFAQKNMKDKNFGGSKFGNGNSFAKDLAIARIIAQHRLNIFCVLWSISVNL